MLVELLLTEDSSLGKIDRSTLSQQTLMELFIEGITNKQILCGSAEDPKDLSEWRNIHFNDSLEVVELNWMFLSLRGSIALQWLPSTVKKLIIIKNIFSDAWMVGTLDLTSLPDSLKYLKLSGNRFEGEISLTTLPSEMDFLDVSYNRLYGSLDLTSLPPKMSLLYLSGNTFGGLTDFSRLPESLKELDITDNIHLEGVIRVNARKLVCRVVGSKVQQNLI